MNPDLVAAAREHLPAWAPWGNLALAPAAFAFGWLFTALAVRLTTPRVDASLHWTERARLLWGARLVMRAGLIAPTVLWVWAGWRNGGPVGHLGPRALGALCGAAAFAGAYLARARAENRLRGTYLGLGAWLRGSLAAAVVVMPHVLLALAVGAFVPARFTAPVVAGVAAFVPALLFLASGGGLFLASAAGLARPPSERLARVVAVASERVGHAPSAAYELPLAFANAFAFPLWNRLAFTPQLLDALTDEELSAVCAHELAHLSETRATAWMRAATAASVAAPLALARPLLALGGLAAFYGAVAASFVLVALMRRRARAMEERADAVAHAHQHDEGGYARALARIYEVNLVPAVLGRRPGVHPHLYDRLVSAGVTPDYPRPTPPPLGRAMAVAFALTLLGGVAVVWGDGLLDDTGTASEGAQVAAVALTGARGQAPGDLALARFRAGDLEGAVALWRLEAANRLRSVYPAANAALALARMSRCAEAGEALADAERRLDAWRREGRGTAGDADIVAGAREALVRCNP